MIAKKNPLVLHQLEPIAIGRKIQKKKQHNMSFCW